MKTVLKGIKYLKESGIKGFFDRTKLHLEFEKSKEFINKNGLYKLKKKNKCLFLKSKEIYVISQYNYFNSKIKNKISMLNMLGYKVYYYHLEEDNRNYEYVLPVVQNKKVTLEEINKINNKLVLIEGDIKVHSSNQIYKGENNKIPSKFINNITIIVLNYNNKSIIFDCLDSLIKFNNYKYHIILVDNGSTDGSYEMIKEKYQNKIKILKNEINGCSSGRNMAIKSVNTDYLMFLDSDQIVLNSNWLDNFLKIINDETVVGWAAGWFNKEGIAGAITDNYDLRCMPPEMLYRTDIGYLGSGGLLLTKKIIDETEGFDINYDPTGYEDTDMSLQIRNLGYELVYCPYLSIEHKAHQTTNNILNEKRIQKNADYFKNKWQRINKELLNYRR